MRSETSDIGARLREGYRTYKEFYGMSVSGIGTPQSCALAPNPSNLILPYSGLLGGASYGSIRCGDRPGEAPVVQIVGWRMLYDEQ